MTVKTQIAGALSSLFVFTAASCCQASAAGCGDIVPGAHLGSNIVDDGFEPSFLAKYKNACIVSWVGGNRGQAGRDADERKCKSLPGTQFLEFVPDHGSNRNTCVFAPTSDDDGEADSDNQDSSNNRPSRQPVPQITPPPRQQQQPPAKDNGYYTLKACNKTGEAKISMAISVKDNPTDKQYTTQGWWVIANNECATISRNLGPYSSAKVYLHAEDKNFTWWTGGNIEVSLCINAHNVFKRLADTTPCSNEEKLSGFRSTTVFPGQNVFNFTR